MTQFQGKFRLERANLQKLFDALTRRGYQIVGPTVRDRAIVYEQLNSVADSCCTRRTFSAMRTRSRWRKTIAPSSSAGCG
jgi:hypothetical protein